MFLFSIFVSNWCLSCKSYVCYIFFILKILFSRLIYRFIRDSPLISCRASLHYLAQQLNIRTPWKRSKSHFAGFKFVENKNGINKKIHFYGRKDCKHRRMFIINLYFTTDTFAYAWNLIFA